MDKSKHNNRVAKSRAENKDDGGENISGTIDAETANDLDVLVQYHKTISPDSDHATKIGTIRWCIHFAADELRKKGNI